MCHQAVGCRKHKAGNEVGLSMAQGQPSAEPLASCSVFISQHCPVLKDAVQLPKGVCV